MATGTSKMDVRYHIIDDFRIEPGLTSDEQIAAMAKHSPEIRRRRFSITSLCYHPGRQTIFCGTTNSGGNLLLEFHPRAGRFKSMGFQKHADDHDVKIHKGLCLDKEANALYFGVATLSPVPKLVGARGGRLVRYDIVRKRFEMLGIPVPGGYVQAIAYDKARRLVYSFSDYNLSFSVWSLARKRLVRSHVMGSIVHVAALDDAGGVWGTYDMRNHAFFRYDPDADEFVWPEGCKMPTSSEGANVMYVGGGPVDCMINGGDGYLYVASTLAELYRLNPETYEVTYLGRPFPFKRMPGLVVGEDGLLYMVGGDDNATTFCRYDRRTGAFEVLGRVAAPDGTTCYRPHDLLVIGRTAYVAETDNRVRSGYLWECRF